MANIAIIQAMPGSVALVKGSLMIMFSRPITHPSPIPRPRQEKIRTVRAVWPSRMPVHPNSTNGQNSISNSTIQPKGRFQAVAHTFLLNFSIVGVEITLGNRVFPQNPGLLKTERMKSRKKICEMHKESVYHGRLPKILNQSGGELSEAQMKSTKILLGLKLSQTPKCRLSNPLLVGSEKMRFTVFKVRPRTRRSLQCVRCCVQDHQQIVPKVEAFLKGDPSGMKTRYHKHRQCSNQVQYNLSSWTLLPSN